MPSARNDVIGAIRQLEADRQRHMQAIHDIDAILARVSRAVAPHVAQAALAAPPPDTASTPPITHRGKFKQTGEQSILQFVKTHGNPTTSEINEHWRAEGRRGVANVVLLKLLKQGLISRRHDPGTRGSRYTMSPGIDLDGFSKPDQRQIECLPQLPVPAEAKRQK
jgi:hypothetical protein